MFTKILITLYTVIAIGTMSLMLMDYPKCFKIQHPTGSISGGFLIGLEVLFVGAVWPVTLPGMMAIYGDMDGLFCS